MLFEVLPEVVGIGFRHSAALSVVLHRNGWHRRSIAYRKTRGSRWTVASASRRYGHHHALSIIIHDLLMRESAIARYRRGHISKTAKSLQYSGIGDLPEYAGRSGSGFRYSSEQGRGRVRVSQGRTQKSLNRRYDNWLCGADTGA